MIDLFFSYSHRDQTFRDELEVHLAMLKRQNLIRTWHDRRIPPGTGIDGEISEHLEAADVILLLVSPYFLASDYCYDVEMRRALERHSEGSAVVLPVILQPCDWQNAHFRHLRATPTDGKPVAKHPNAHDAFLDVTNDIRWAAQQVGKADSPTREATPAAGPGHTVVERTSNLRMRKTFTDHDRDRFADDAFSYIRRFFENSLEELSARNPGLKHRFKNVGETEFSAAIYVDGEKRSSCRIWQPGRDAFGGAIAYAASDAGSGSGINDSMTVADDGYTMGMRPMGWAHMGSQSQEMLTPHGAGEYFWSILIARLQ